MKIYMVLNFGSKIIYEYELFKIYKFFRSCVLGFVEV